MLTKETYLKWIFLSQKDKIDIENLFKLQIQQLEKLPKDLEAAKKKLKTAWLKNKERFDKIH